MDQMTDLKMRFEGLNAKIVLVIAALNFVSFLTTDNASKNDAILSINIK